MQKANQNVTGLEVQNIESQDAHTMLTQMVGSLSNGILAYKLPNYEILIFNDAAKTLFGCTEDDSPEHLRAVMKRIMPENGRAVFKAMNAIAKPGDSAEYIIRISQEDGSVKIAQAYTRQLQFQDGTPFILSCMQDITERSKLDELLKQERMQYRNALIKNSTFHCSFDLTEGKILRNFITAEGRDPIQEFGLRLPASYEKFAQKWVEKDKPEFINKASMDVLTQKGLLKRFESGETSIELEYRNPKSNRYYRITALLSRNREDNHIYVFLIGKDTTELWKEEQRKKQEILDAKAALEDAYAAANRANAAKSDFLSRMSHDIRTPMNAIIGMTAIAENYLDKPDRVKDCLEKITVSSRHLLGLINEVLDMSKIESGKVDLIEEEFNLSDLIDNLLMMSKPQIMQKNHKLVVSNQGIKHAQVIGDGQRLQQTLMNMMSNAIKYTPDGGKIELTVSERPTHNVGIGSYEFVFQDNGIGMSQEFMKHLFDPFSRSDDERVAKIQGTGLGMAIARNIVRMMNGDIQVESALDQGSKITINISLKLQDTAKSVSTEEKEKSLDTLFDERFRGKRVLLVDDNELNSEIAGEVLDMAGLEVEFASNGQEALQRVEQAEDGYYDLIFMDIQMPIMNGYQAAKAIRALPGEYSRKVPIIAMTANAFAEDVRQALQAGMNEHITKPIDFVQLDNTLKKWL